jgi:imidazole glycerol-phosphate synthase subunit HisH
VRVTVFDYGAGNLHSLLKALAGPDREIAVETDARKLPSARMLVLPGVGAFQQAAERLAPARAELRDALADGLPCIGICLGMQLLFEDSEEGQGKGLGFLPGPVERLKASVVPHIGWNQVKGAGESLLDAAELDLAYFANSYVCRPTDTACVTAWTTHESDRFAAAVRAVRTLGLQFHPEKSSAAGVRYLRAALGAMLSEAP